MQDTGADMQAPQDAAEDAQAQQLLVEAMQQEPQEGEPQAEEQEQEETPWSDPARAEREIKKLRREAAKYRTQLRDMEPELQQFREWQDSQLSEQERLAKQVEELRRERDEAVLGHARMMAAATHNIPPELIGRIAGTTPEEIEDAAAELAEVLDRLVAERAAAVGRPASTRPVESLRPGGSPASAEPPDMDSLLRRRAGF